MKIDITKITGYAEMTPEEKVKALEELEFAEPTAADPDEIKKYKKLIDDATAEAASFKKKYQASLSDAERKEMERAEKEKKLAEELQAYKDKERVSNYTAQFMGAGYDEATAKRLAVSLPDGMSEDFFAAQKEYIAAVKQQVAIQNINSVPKPSAGTPVTGNQVYDEQTEKLKQYFGLK